MNTNILMVYPHIPSTYWSFRYAMDYIGKRSVMPPLGLITVASMLPESWNVRLIDMNIQDLKREDILAADLVFVSAMIVQKNSMKEVIGLCRDCGTPVVAGGPYPTASHEQIEGVDHFVLGEAEANLQQFIADWERGEPQGLYPAGERPSLRQSPVPRYDLLDIGHYHNMAIQTSRGCPFNCEFCDIIEMFGRVPRYKDPDQVVSEMEAIHAAGFRGALFVVDDNFIGNKKAVSALLERVIHWQEEKQHPFTLFTEASINLAADDRLLDLMVKAGFDSVFVGLETPDTNTLSQISKGQNTAVDVIESVKKIQSRGIEVMGGFIVGFDSDDESIFERQVEFIKHAAIPMAMVGMLLALPNTRLHRRLQAEGRLTGDTDGNNTGVMGTNFITTMPRKKLIEGYERILKTVYHPRTYFARCRELLRRMPVRNTGPRAITPASARAFFRSLFRQTFSSYGWWYLSFLTGVLMTKPGQFPLAVTLAVKGLHFFRTTSEIIESDAFTRSLSRIHESLTGRLAEMLDHARAASPQAVFRTGRAFSAQLKRQYGRLDQGLRSQYQSAYRECRITLEIMTHEAILTLLQRHTAGVEAP